MKYITDIQNLKATFLIIFGAMCFSTVTIFTRYTQNMNVMTIAFFRAFFAFVFFIALLPWFPRTRHIALYSKSILALLGLGFTVGITAVLYIYAIQHTTVANATLLVNSAPIYVALLSPLVGDQRAKNRSYLIILAIIGILLISDPTRITIRSSNFKGIIAGICSGITFSLTLLISRHLRDKVTGFTQGLWSTGFAALFLSPWLFQTRFEIVQTNIPVLIPLGVISLGLGYQMYFYGLKLKSAQDVSIFALFEPVSGVVIGMFLFQEFPNLIGLIGIVMIMVCILIASRF